MILIQGFFSNYPWVLWSLGLGGILVFCSLLARTLKDGRIWPIVLATVFGLVFMLPPNDPDGPRRPGPDGVMGNKDDEGSLEGKLKRGIDLQGGTILVYQVDTSKVTSAWSPTEMDRMIAALSKRVNPAGTLDVTMRPMGGDRIEIILPAADPQEVQALQDRITQMGQLEFRILASEKHDGAMGNHAIEKAREKLSKDADINLVVGRQRYQWVKVFDQTEIGEFGKTPGETVALQDGYVLSLVPDETMHVTGEYLTRSEPGQDNQLRPAVRFRFNATGTRRFAKLTRTYQPEPDDFQYRLAIILDNKVMSAPVINSPIEGGDGIIEGGREGFKLEKVEELVAVLNAGKLPAMLIQTPISKDTVTTTLGEETIRKGTRAILIAMVIVPVFMLCYYVFSGLVANIALLLNLILILGFMGFSQSTFTLPGLAGLALTIGMAVDANVLIFERIREERERGSSLRQSIRNGFDRAWLAIFDSNLTTIITGAILYWLGTDQVKGYALTLIIGLASNLFTAVFVSRTIFEIWERNGWIKELRMFHLIKTPTFDYVTPRYYFITGSAVVIGVGLIVVVARGTNLLDIDFTGGTAISVELTDTTKGPDYVRDEAELAGLPDVKVERLIPEGATKDESMFLVRTTMQDQDQVRKLITQHFHGKLQKLATVRITDDGWNVEPIEEPKPDAAEEVDKEKTAETQPQDKPAVPFAGGHRVKIKLNRPVGRDAVAAKIDQAIRAEGVSDPSLHYSLRVGELEKLTAQNFILETSRDVESLKPKLAASLESDPIYQRENNFKSQVAGETRTKAIMAMVLSWVAMVFYLWFRFKNVSYGFAAVVALVHDVLVALGFVALGGWIGGAVPGLASLLLIDDFKIDLTVVTAFMTIIGYSVNDTIVIFDRIREIKGKSPHVSPDMINQSVNQCMSRTILTSLTVIMVLLIMFIFGGPGLHGFSFAMLIGCVSGTYSTIFIAAPILILFAGKTKTATIPKGVQFEGAGARA